MNDTPNVHPQMNSEGLSNEPGRGQHTLVEDVDTGPASTTQEQAPSGSSRRFNLDEDALGPDQSIHEEKADPITIDFGAPGPTEWFHIDPRPGRSIVVTMAKLKPPGADRDKLFYVPKSGRNIPELQAHLRPYTLHVIQKKIGPKTVRTALWPRRHPTTFKGGGEDKWGATDTVVAERAAKGWIRRETDPDAGAGRRSVSPNPSEPPPPDHPWDDRPLAELMHLAIPVGDVIADDEHPLVRFLRYGR
jgi:hypothetical protein